MDHVEQLAANDYLRALEHYFKAFEQLENARRDVRRKQSAMRSLAKSRVEDE